MSTLYRTCIFGLFYDFQKHTSLNALMLDSVIQICLEKNLNFSVFSYPNQSDFNVVIENPTLQTKSKSGFVMHPFQVTINSPEVFIPEDISFTSQNLPSRIIRELHSLPDQPEFQNTYEKQVSSKTSYLKNLQKGLDQMESFGINKFVYSRIEVIENHSNLHIPKLIAQLNRKHTSAFVYLVNHRSSGLWAGATPETLISWSGAQISSMSLAGTKPNNGTTPVWAEKEIEEHDYVTQYIETAFTDASIPYHKEETKTILAGSVFHLQTLLESKTSITYTQAFSLANMLHPTPAICGVPLDNSKKLIEKIEQHNRQYYTGYLGYIEPDHEIRLFVNLRCMQILPKNVALYLGGGITKKSIPIDEWEETIHKSKTLLEVIHSTEDS